MKKINGEIVVSFTLKGYTVVVYDDGNYDIPYHAYLISNGKQKHIDDYDSLTQCCENIIYACTNGYIENKEVV